MALLPFMLTTPDTRPFKSLGDGVRRRIRSYGPDLMAVEVAFDTGGVGAIHTHPHRQLTYCLSGRFTFTIDGKEVPLGPGDTLHFDADVPHGCTALEAGVLLDLFTPLRADFLKADGLTD